MSVRVRTFSSGYPHGGDSSTTPKPGFTKQYSTSRPLAGSLSLPISTSTRPTCQSGTPRDVDVLHVKSQANIIPSSLPTPARASQCRLQRAPAVMGPPPRAPGAPRHLVQRYRSQPNMGTQSLDAFPGQRLDLALSPGDVLCVQGTPGGIMRLGATGGYQGHVLLVTAPPRGVQKHTAEAIQFQAVWPEDHDVRVLWRVRTLESTRNEEGFHESDHLLYVEEKTGRILVVAEEHCNQFNKFVQPERVDIWQCPSNLRKCFRIDIMNNVLEDMRQNEASWSWSTAVRAFLFSAEVSENSHKASMLQDIQQCWGAEPICSSLIVVFWQRYLCGLADLYNAIPGRLSAEVEAGITIAEVDALDWILEWMPLKGDRALPGELLSTMQQCGWVLVSRAPRAARARLQTW